MVSIAPATAAELCRTGELHRQTLDSGLFPALGRRFLSRYHATFVASPYAVALVARDQGRPVGFLLGTTDNAAHYRWSVRHHGWRLALSGLLAMLLRPPVLWRFVTTRAGRYLRGLYRHLRPRPRPVGAAEPTDPDAPPRRRTAILTHVATDPRRRTRGVGRALTERFLATARRDGAAEARLITLVDGEASGFYTRLGWHAVTDRPARDGTAVREFRMPLTETEPS